MDTPQLQNLTKKAEVLEAELARVVLSASDLRSELQRLSAFHAAGSTALAGANHRTEAVRAVLDAVLRSIKPRALDRKRFQEIVNQESSNTPNEGPASERHAILLAEARKVLGIKS